MTLREKLASPRVRVEGYQEVFTEEKTFESHGSVVVLVEGEIGKIIFKKDRDPEQKSGNIKM